ncbi:hypothetical protein [Stutzerimonas stutzeri]|uniref:hypothetical protein n=1 Tax=Stutzerimonas stutzeri TaxID=316 RepID=UPI000A5C7172|nr:hypothetical protein [Stutzerimonas stutzeri]
MLEFLNPYVMFLYGASHNLHQILEGLGIVSSSFVERNNAGDIVGGYWSPTEAMIPTLGGLTLIALFTIALAAGASWTIGRMRGLLTYSILLCTPGILSWLGAFPTINYLPTRFSINGAGALGSEIGLIALLTLCVIFGWAVVLIAYDNLNLTERFRQIYDHFWFPLALVAAVFFVADNGANKDLAVLEQAESEITGASGYLLSQVRRYNDHCKHNDLQNLRSCQWSQYVQHNLTEISRNGAFYYIEFAPDSSAGYYAAPGKAITDEAILEIRLEIAKYNNDLCPVTHFSREVSRSAPLSSTCERAPLEFCSAQPDPGPGLVNSHIAIRTVALASECIIPRLASSKDHLRKLSNLVSQHEISKNYRWLYFLVVAALVGGKVALSTTKLCSMDARSTPDRKRLFKLAVAFFLHLLRFVHSILSLLPRLIRQLRN